MWRNGSSFPDWMPDEPMAEQTENQPVPESEPIPAESDAGSAQDWGAHQRASRELRMRPARLPNDSDPIFVRIGGLVLGVTILFSMTGIVFLGALGMDIPGSVVAIGAAAVGALAGVLGSRQ